MRTEELLEHADYLLGVLAIRNGKQIDNARNWLVTVLNRRFYDMLRSKYRKPLVFCGVDYALARDTVEAPDLPEAGDLTEERKRKTSAAWSRA